MSTTNVPTSSPSAAWLTLPAAAGGALLAVMVGLDLDPGGPVRAALAALMVLGGGVGLGPLLLVTPVEPSPVKLWLFSSLLGLPLVAGLAWLAAGPLGASPQAAWAAPFAVTGALALAASRRRLGVAPPGKAALAAVALGTLGAVLAWGWLASATGLHAVLADPTALVHLTLADGAVRGQGSVNPWFVGGALDLRPAVAAALAGLAAAADVPVDRALPLAMGWSVLALTLCGYLAAAAAFREQAADRAGYRDLLAAALALLLVGLLPALDVLRRGALLGEASVGLDPGAALARTYGAAALLAGLHAVRRGARPWPLLAALLTGVAALAQPWLGACLLVAVGGPALVRGRSTLPPLLLGACLPAFWVGRAFGGFTLDQVAGAGPPEPLAWTAPALLGALGLLGLRRWERSDPGSTPGLAVALLAAAAALALPALAGPAAWDASALGAFALFPLSLLAARTLAPGGLTACAAVAALAAAMLLTGQAREAGSAPLVRGPSGPELAGDPELAEGLAAAYLEARALARATPGPVALLRGGSGGSARGAAPSLAPLLGGAGLWADDAAPPGTRQPRFGAARRASTGETDLGDRWVDRRDLLVALFQDRNAWEPRFDRLLRAEVERGATLLFIVTEQDRRRTTDRGVGPRGADATLLRLGARRVMEAPQAALYQLGP